MTNMSVAMKYDGECPVIAHLYSLFFRVVMNESELLKEALKRTGSDLNEFLSEHCKNDSALRRRIELRVHEAGDESSNRTRELSDSASDNLEGSFDVESNLVDNPSDSSEQAEFSSGHRIGPYKLLQLIGEGGMGSVWMASQEEPVRRQVALKLVKSGASGKQVVARFEAERQALAMMEHPNIAKVLDGGKTEDGMPFFVMELVQGIPITEYCDRNKLSPRQRLELFVPVCLAVQHAHQKGIIHRDLKPSNVLIAMQDSKPTPKVIDFGLAKALQATLTDKTMFTEFGQILGTLQYMSPEQAMLDAVDIDTRSDIYSLGVMLYELLAGSTPLERESLRENALLRVLEIIQKRETPRPSSRLSSTGDKIQVISELRQIQPARLQQMLKGDLDWVVMKAVEKDRTRRYATAANFADDIERYLVGNPVEARPPAASYRIGKFVRKNRAIVGTAALIAGLLVAGIAGTSWFAFQANESAIAQKAQADFATKQEEKANASAKRSDDVLAIVEAAFRSADPKKTGSAQMSARDVLLSAKESMATSDLDNLGKIRLLETITVSLLGLGDGQAAVESATEHRELCLATLGRNDPSTLAAMHNLAKALDLAGDKEAALQLREETFIARKQVLGDEHPDSLTTLSDLAISYFSAGRTEQGLELFQIVMDKRMAILGEAHADTLMSMNNVANAYMYMGRLDEAIEIHERVLPKRIQLLGAEHADTLQSQYNLGNCYVRVGRDQDAIKLQENSYSRRRVKLGENHIETIQSLRMLADQYYRARQYEQGLRANKQVLEFYREHYGSDDKLTFGVMAETANFYEATGQHEEALALRETALEGMRRVLGEDNRTTLVTIGNLAMSYDNLGRQEEAIALREELLDKFKTTLGEDHADTAKLMLHLARDYESLERFDEAFALGQQALEIRVAKYGTEHPESATAMGFLAEQHLNLRQCDETLKLATQALAIREKLLGPDHIDTVRNRNTLASWLEDTEARVSEALRERKYQRAEELIAAIANYHGPHLVYTKRTPYYRHLTHFAQGDFQQALDAVQTWLPKLDPSAPADREMIASAHAAEAQCYLELGLMDAAKTAAQKAIAISAIAPADKLRCQIILTAADARESGSAIAKSKEAAELYSRLEGLLDTTAPDLQWSVLGACDHVSEIYELVDDPAQSQAWKMRQADLASKIQEINQALVGNHRAQQLANALWRQVSKPPSGEHELSLDEVAVLRRICEQSPDVAYFLPLAAAEFHLGDHESAITAAEKGLAAAASATVPIQQPNPVFYAVLAMSQLALGNQEAAQQEFQRLDESMQTDYWRYKASTRSYLSLAQERFSQTLSTP